MPKKYTVKSITNVIEDLFPLNIAEEWDKVGIQVGSPKKIVNKIVVALDLTNNVANYAIENQVDFIVTFHPFLFSDTDFEKVPKQPWKRKVVERLKNTGITTYSIHTSFDKESKGMPLAIKNRLNLRTRTKSIKGVKFGLIFQWGKTLGQLMQYFKKCFELSATLSNVEKKRTQIYNFAFLPGSGSIEDMQIAWANNDIDLIITSDIKWSDWITLEQENINVMEVSHIVEKVFVEHMSNFLVKMFKNIEILPFKTKSIIKHS